MIWQRKRSNGNNHLYLFISCSNEIIVVEAAVMLEAGWTDLVDEVRFVIVFKLDLGGRS